MPNPIDTRRLETFRVVATVGQVSAAAHRLHLSQPAVTAQLRKLEQECGLPLFVRNPRGVTLNQSGRILLEYAQRVHELVDEAGLALHVQEGAEGDLVIAASTTIASYVVPRLVSRFLRSQRRVGVHVEVGNTNQVLEWVRAGRVPLGLVEGHSRAPGMRLEPFLNDELVPVVSSNAPAELRSVQRLSDLKDVPIIWREPGSGTRAVVERALRAARVRRTTLPGDLQLGSTEAIKGAVADGLGVGFLSRWSISLELALGRLRVITIPGLRIPRSFSWALPADDPAGLPGLFLRLAREEAKALRP